MACKARMETLIGIIICLDADEKDCYEICGAHRLSVHALGLLMSCSPQEPVSEQTLKGCPAILPDYTGVTIPSNIAPLRFALEEEAEKAVAVISGRKDKLIVDAEDGSFLIPEKKWHELLESSVGDSLQVKVYVRKDGRWCMYEPFSGISLRTNWMLFWYIA